MRTQINWEITLKRLVNVVKFASIFIHNICQLYTQYLPGNNLDYSALLYAFQGLNRWASKCLENPTVYIPRIGAGIAGGDWNKIKLIIDMFTPDIDIIVVDWDGE
ncbi:hypothetical protein ACQ31_gp174 [Salmonella phage STML-198]|uniref:Macro domain-containing protein n=1 Tax=Salmonella phage STML-198 TaxID=1204531 RepID=K4I435_9CAUD|nr:hypothetical protein ACQ31_gp174 [Salmonella phage STML-198]AFU64057.1 hypothetical protein [Salmonella phage STML-198]